MTTNIKYPIQLIGQQFNEYYEAPEIEKMLTSVLAKLGLKKQEEYRAEDFLNILRKLKDFGGSASFCASVLIIDTISTKRQDVA